MREEIRYRLSFCRNIVREIVSKIKCNIGGIEDDIDDKPLRPHISILVISALLLWSTCAWSYANAQGFSEQLCIAIIIICACCSLVSISLLLIRRIRKKAYLIIGTLAFLTGIILGTAQGLSNHVLFKAINDSRFDTCELFLVEDLEEGYRGEEAEAKAVFPNGIEGHFLVRFPKEASGYCNERFRAKISINQFVESMKERGWSKGQLGVIDVKEYEQLERGFPLSELIHFRRRIIDSFISIDREPTQLFLAIVCGYRTTIKQSDLYSYFQQCGLAHLVAVSGAHLMIVAGMILVICRLLRLSRRTTITIMILFMYAYYCIAGMPISALRAIIMTSAGLLSFFAKRRPHALNAVGLSIILIIWFNPASALSVSLLLSALSTLGIIFFSPLINYWLHHIPIIRTAPLREPLSLTFSALLLTQLCTASLFHKISLVAPLANCIAAPLFTILCCFGLIGSMAISIFPFLTNGIHMILEIVYGFVISIITAISQIPFAALPLSFDLYFGLLITGVIAILLIILWPVSLPKPFLSLSLVPPAITIVTLILIFSFTPFDNDKIVMLDVGQGDSILIQSKDQSLLIDTGNKDSLLLKGLSDNHIAYLDNVLITHADDDHCGSLDALRKVVEVDTIFIAKGLMDDTDPAAQKLVQEAKKSARQVKEIGKGEMLDIGSFQGRVVWPDHIRNHGGNSDSLVLLLEYDGNNDAYIDYRILMTGDAEKEEIRSIVHEGLVGDIDILKIGHHGSRNGLYEDDLKVLSPEMALISCGVHNRYGHPAPFTLELLQKYTVDIYRSDFDGEVTCNFNAQEVRITSKK